LIILAPQRWEWMITCNAREMFCFAQAGILAIRRRLSENLNDPGDSDCFHALLVTNTWVRTSFHSRIPTVLRPLNQNSVKRDSSMSLQARNTCFLIFRMPKRYFLASNKMSHVSTNISPPQPWSSRVERWLTQNKRQTQFARRNNLAGFLVAFSKYILSRKRHGLDAETPFPI
jgi:hypothetical protein